MSKVKVMISLPPDILEATDAVAKAQYLNRSQLIVEALKNYPDVYEVLQGIKEANEAVAKE